MPSNNSRSPSPELRFCRWGFACTESFPSKIRLLQHVILDHVRIAVPVYRHEIPTLLRTTEGIGESYETEHFLSPVEQRQDNSQQVKNLRADSQISAPAASLPSPPTSLSPRLHENDEDRDSGFSGSDSEGQEGAHSPNLYVSDEDIDILGQAANVLLSDTLEPPSPGFASLATSTGSPRPGAIPPSPTFSDIVASSTQKSSTGIVSKRLIRPAVSQCSTSSFNSCAAVEAQLTQLGEEYSIDDDVALPGQSQGLATAGSGDSHIFQGEPQRIPQSTFDSQPPHSRDGSGDLADSVDDLSDAQKTHVFRFLIGSLLDMSSSDLNSVAADHRIQRAQREKMLESFASHTCTLRCVVHKNDAISAGILRHEPVVARDYGHILLQRPFSQVPAQNTTPNQHSVLSRPPSFGVPITRKQSWYGVRSRKRSRGDGLSPLESPLSLSPVQTSTRSKLSVNPNASYKTHDNTSESSLHRKRYKLDSSPEHNTTKKSSDKARHHSTSPECDADVSQMQVETQLTMSPSHSPHQEPYDKQYELYGYALQTQPAYDSQQ
ncbi:hypothetical protein BDP27DRAFT_1397906 [Rhodocollybia butyracea]|uniref:Uncharacterized protein n=1 Tax=Rhodocollybia butyracea TaxID=206335 RepID=A0A9P5Q1X4_9AGAR|nr:hypothetical protein BDP27DRAFT_1397906 [Rhodocollybia butyracea]